jgi:F-type H+-transporting ATPase subunit b
MILHMIAAALAAAEPEGLESAGDYTGGGATMPQFDPSSFASQIFWLIITFGALYLVLSKVALPRIAGVIEERQDTIADNLDRAETARRQAHEAEETRQEALRKARQRASETIHEAVAKARKDSEAREDEADEAARQRVDEALSGIAERRDRALDEIRSVAVDNAVIIAQQILGREVDRAQAENAAGRLSGRQSQTGDEADHG